MEISFWQARWDTGQIGFHEGTPNQFLTRYLSKFGANKRVLVPLCGKTYDMTYLAQNGFRVVGVEAIERAAQQYYSENTGLGPVSTQNHGKYIVYSAGPVDIVVGDMLKASQSVVGSCDVAYDRAALVALKPEDRATYIDTLRTLMGPGSSILLVTYSYDTDKISGPPFSIDRTTVEQLFGGKAKIEHLETTLGEGSPKFKEANVQPYEHCFLITFT